jgi:hypothetical protein
MPGTCPNLDYIEEVLKKANENPINKDFKPPGV